MILAFAILYLATLDDGLRPGELEGGDLITHQYAQVQGRPGNAPGYPLYTMGGWAWYRLGRLVLGPDHNPIQILSAYSTFWALVALWLLYRLILEVTDRSDGGNWAVAMLVTAFYGTTYFFWYYAVTTEQYTSAVAWTLAIVYLAFRWERTRRHGYLQGIAILIGVGLAHMVTVLFVVPPLLWFILGSSPRPRWRPRQALTLAALALLPLTAYAYVYWSGAAHPEWRGAGQWESNWQWFWAFLSTRQGRDELTWSLTPLLTPEFPSLAWREMTWPGLVAGLLGLAALGRRRAVALYGTLAIYIVFAWIDRLGNWYQVIMPAYAILALGIGAGAGWAWQRAGGPQRGGEPVGGRGRAAPAPPRPGRRGASGAIVRLALVAALLGLAVYRGVASYGRADSSNRPHDTGLDPGWAILADEPPVGARVLGTHPEALALDYLTQIWGVRPDVRTVTSSEMRGLLAVGATPLAATDAALPIVAEEVSGDAHYSAWGGRLIGVSAAPATSLPAGGPAWREQAWTHDFGGVLRIAGGRARRDPARGEGVVLLVWQALSRPAEDWSVSVRLTLGGEEIAQMDRAHPVAGAYPTTRWSPGQVVGDGYPIKVPGDVVPDGVTVVVYRPLPDGTFLNLDVAWLPLEFGEAG